MATIRSSFSKRCFRCSDSDGGFVGGGGGEDETADRVAEGLVRKAFSPSVLHLYLRLYQFVYAYILIWLVLRCEVSDELFQRFEKRARNLVMAKFALADKQTNRWRETTIVARGCVQLLTSPFANLVSASIAPASLFYAAKQLRDSTIGEVSPLLGVLCDGRNLLP